MFWIIVEYGKVDVDLGPVHPQDCDVCQTEQPFRLRFLYFQETFFLFFGVALAKKYVIVCEGCGTPFRIPKAAALKLGLVRSQPIPFMQRFGCLLAILAFALTFLGFRILSGGP